ncbi:hypothetical protein PIB30_050789 [Stylosanthes scabra]|uniref:Replication factor A C-terminal domain-containing protein n=1 Tax=Stylosanthes scabra TaxID=79078 RepID=A0ABU6ZGH7_9FABA|nr:hypothetical protein [Stylosanthes scabra]
MCASYDLLSQLDETNDTQTYKIKVRVLKTWSITHGEHKYQKPMFEMVVMDKEKYKPTTHRCRIYFKRDTVMKLVDDRSFPENIFHFVPNEVILSHGNAQSHLIDVIGLLTGKGDTVEFTRNGKACIYIVLDLDDMKGNGKVRCTLWEEYATKLVKHIEEQPATDVMRSGIEYTNVLQIVADPPYSLEDDLLKNCAYKSISQLNNSLENGTFVTLGTVVGIDVRNGWWYKSCKQCFTSLKEEENSYHCFKCDSFPTTHVPRYSINLKVADDTETASFLLYDKEATKFICMFASDLRVAQLTRDSTTPSVNASTDVVDDASGSFCTPKRALFAPQFTKELVDEYPDSAENSSSKTRKVLLAPEDVSVVKVHTE